MLRPSMNEDPTTTANPTATYKRNCHGNGNPTMPPPTKSNDDAKVM